MISIGYPRLLTRTHGRERVWRVCSYLPPPGAAVRAPHGKTAPTSPIEHSAKHGLSLDRGLTAAINKSPPSVPRYRDKGVRPCFPPVLCPTAHCSPFGGQSRAVLASFARQSPYTTLKLRRHKGLFLLASYHCLTSRHSRYPYINGSVEETAPALRYPPLSHSPKVVERGHARVPSPPQPLGPSSPVSAENGRS